MCQHFQPTYDKIAGFFQTQPYPTPKVVVARVDCANEVITDLPAEDRCMHFTDAHNTELPSFELQQLCFLPCWQSAPALPSCSEPCQQPHSRTPTLLESRLLSDTTRKALQSHGKMNEAA